MENVKVTVAVICAFVGLLPLLFWFDDAPVRVLWLAWFLPLGSIVRKTRT